MAQAPEPFVFGGLNVPGVEERNRDALAYIQRREQVPWALTLNNFIHTRPPSPDNPVVRDPSEEFAGFVRTCLAGNAPPDDPFSVGCTPEIIESEFWNGEKAELARQIKTWEKLIDKPEEEKYYPHLKIPRTNVKNMLENLYRTMEELEKDYLTEKQTVLDEMLKGQGAPGGIGVTSSITDFLPKRGGKKLKNKKNTKKAKKSKKSKKSKKDKKGKKSKKH